MIKTGNFSMENNWNVIGHQQIIAYLNNCLKNRQSLAHAYLFYGGEGLGKTKVAEEFASLILRHHSGQSPEFYPLSVLDDKQEIGIEQVRDWRARLSLKSFSEGSKVGLIYDADKLNRESANALLKTLEEPSLNTVIIIVTSNWSRLLNTIVSRAQRIKFLPVPSKVLSAGLKDKVSDSVKLKNILELSCGRPGLALNLAQNDDFYQEYKDLQQLAQTALNGSLAERFGLLDSLFRDTAESKQKNQAALGLISHLEMQLRARLLSYFNAQADVVKNSVILLKITSALEMIKKAKIDLESNIQPKLILENILINL